MITNNSEDFRSLIDTVKKVAEADGDDNILSILARSEITVEQTGYDNWNGGINYYTIYLRVDVNKFIELRSDLINELLFSEPGIRYYHAGQFSERLT